MLARNRMRDVTEHDALRRLSELARELKAEHDVEFVLTRLLEEARVVTGARYAAIGVLSKDRTRLERFLTLGVDEATQQAIGGPPRGRGVLGLLIEDPRPLRLSDVRGHPHRYGCRM